MMMAVYTRFTYATTRLLKLILFTSTDKPESVVITPVNGTSVNISWSGSTHLSTRLQYIVYCTNSGSVMSRYTTEVQPGVSSTIISIRDDIIIGVQYQHNFTLHYITADDVIPPFEHVATASFSFG